MAQQMELGLITKDQMNNSQWNEYCGELARMTRSEKKFHLMMIDFNDE